MSKVKQYPSKEYLEANYLYKDGWLINKRSGKKVGCNTKKYTMVNIEGSLYSAHRLIWIIHNNENPKNDLDHINRNKHDNRIENLRIASRSENCLNRGYGKDGSCIGVSFRNGRNRWRAYIMVEGLITRLGSTKTLFEACCLRKSAELNRIKGLL